MRGLGFSKSDVDGTDECAGDYFDNPVSRATVAVPNEHASTFFWREFVYVSVFLAGIGRASKNLDMGEVTRDTMEGSIRHATRTAGSGVRRKPVAQLDSRTHDMTPVIFGGAVGLL
jgi:hypothetical protein